MRLTTHFLFLTCVLVISGCASSKPAKFSDVPSPATGASGAQPVVKPSDVLTGKVATFNSVRRFAVLTFPMTRMPSAGQTLFLYRGGLKVGEVKITGPQKEDKIVADLINGEAKPGDEVRDR